MRNRLDRREKKKEARQRFLVKEVIVPLLIVVISVLFKWLLSLF